MCHLYFGHLPVNLNFPDWSRSGFSSLNSGGSLETRPFIWLSLVSPGVASSSEWFNKDIPDWPLQTGRDSASASVERKKKTHHIYYQTNFSFSSLNKSMMTQPVLGVLVSLASSAEGRDPSGLSEFPFCSNWSSTGISSSAGSEQVAGLGCGALYGCFDNFWCARPPDLALPLAPFPFLFLLKITHRKALMRYNGMLIICRKCSACSGHLMKL